ncbi:MAG: DNA polymerase I, partial [Flavobacteriales bacterium]
FLTYMMTSDKDYGQLVSDNIFIYKPGYQGGKAEVLGIPEVLLKFDIERVDQVIDILGMMGDAVDNIPGIPGVGEKTAVKLLKQFGSLEGLLANTDQLKGKQKENVENFADQAIMSKKLATILLDAPTPLNEEDLKIKEYNKESLKDIFNELEFRQLAKRVLGEETPAAGDVQQGSLFGEEELEAVTVPSDLKKITDIPHHYILVETEQMLGDLLEKLKTERSFCFDTETSDLEPINAYLVGMSFAVVAHEAYYVPVPKDQNEARILLQKFAPIFSDSEKELIGQNIKYDYKMLGKYGIEVKNKLFDTMVAHYILSPDGKHGMDVLAAQYLQYEPVSIETLIGKKGKNQGSMADLSPAEIKDYAAEDADITLQLKHIFEPKLTTAESRKLFDEVEVPLITVLADMEMEGVRVDEQFLKDYSNELQKDIVIFEKEIHEIAGEVFNIDSPKQLGTILFEKLKITDQVKKTKTGQYATGEDILSKFVHDHPVVGKILDYRELRKLKSTYVDALPELINKHTGRVHTNYMQTVAATGRLSSNNPNLQNIPIRTSRGKEIRKAFVPRNEEYTLLSADYSQVELRIIAALSNDENMCEAFLQGADIHAATASKVFSVPLDQVDKSMRSKAKAVNFGIIYGQGAFGLAQNLGIPRGEAKEIIDSYFKQFNRLKAYQQENIENARKTGFVETILGRRRYLADINSANAVVRGFAERNAINAPIQGSAADIIKVAMIRIQEDLRKMKLRSKMILQVHDELVFDVHKEELDSIQPVIAERMTTAVKMRVPLEIDMNHGDNWLQAH